MIPPKYRFSLRPGNRFRLLVDGDAFYPAMLARIAAARREVLLEMYLFESGRVAERFIAALTAAVARGVAVAVLLDGFGSLRLRRRDRERLVAGGVQVVQYNPLRPRRWRRNLLRNHRKALLVDGAVAYTGGAGIADQFDPAGGRGRHWHETMLEMEGPIVADWRTLFAETWNQWSGGLLPPLPGADASPGEGTEGRLVVHSRRVGRSEIMASFVRHVRQARQQVWLATAYFVPPWKLRRALRKSARKGVDVRLMLPGPVTDHPAVRHFSRCFYEPLLRAGVRIFEFQPRFLHVKILLCDDWVSLGSSNADRWNHRWSLEANQELVDAVITQQVRELFLAGFGHSRELHYEEWRHRSWRRRLPEWWWRWVGWWINRYGHRGKVSLRD